MPDPNSRELLLRYQDGEDDAAVAIFDRYVERLLRLAGTRIGPKLRRRIDPEDIVQSAYRSFFAHAKDQRYQLTRSGDLWRLLASTTLNKLYGQIEKQTAGKRSIDRETPATTLCDLATREPTVVEIVAVGEQLRIILDTLSSDERFVLTATLQGQNIEEISNAIGKSPRTVRRLLDQAKRRFEDCLLETRPSSSPLEASTVQSPVIDPAMCLEYSNYVLDQLLGSGGMGKVYRATDKRSGQTVAVKALHKSRLSDQRAVARFVQEAQILAKLSHPNIVGVQGLGRFPGGGYFIAMQFVDGHDLQSRLDRGPLPLPEVVVIGKQIASAMQHAHDNGIVHSDLKPGNVLVSNTNHVFVTDFGFACILAGGASANSVGGTAGYMAPELLQSPSQPTPAADIYSLGVLLWTLLTGQMPNDGDLFPCENGSIALARICRRCLAAMPGERYAQGSELIAALHKLEM